MESATAPDGHVRVHQSQAAPFSVGLPSGLARSQQLYMMQRFLNIPATPSYVAKDDGLVLDRVVVNVGGRSWWQTLTLQLRAQRAWNTQEFSKGKPHQVLGDPSMYALGGRFRVGFGAHTVLRGLGELGSLSGAVEDFRRFKKNLSRPAAEKTPTPTRREPPTRVHRTSARRAETTRSAAAFSYRRRRSRGTWFPSTRLFASDTKPRASTSTGRVSSAPPCAPAAKTGSTTAWACATGWKKPCPRSRCPT